MCSTAFTQNLRLFGNAFFARNLFKHSDATSVQVLKEVGKTAQSKSTEWVYCTGTGAKNNINALFKLERKFSKLTPKERYEKRLEESRPISDAFFAWADNLGALLKTLLGEAVSYAKNQRTYLENIFPDGNLELSNNRCERAIKPFVMGRKAWLFSTTPEGIC